MFRRHRSSGFTLIELLVVIAIIALLASVVIASTKNARDKAKNARITADIMEYAKALALYQSNNGGLLPLSYNDGSRCLGKGYPNEECGIGPANLINENSELNSQLQFYFPGPKPPPIGNNMIVTTTGGDTYFIGALYRPLDPENKTRTIETWLQGDASCPHPANSITVDKEQGTVAMGYTHCTIVLN